MTAVTKDDATTTDRGNRGKRIEAARAVGFPVPGPVFVVGITDRRLLLFRAAAGLRRARPPQGGSPFGGIPARRGGGRAPPGGPGGPPRESPLALRPPP